MNCFQKSLCHEKWRNYHDSRGGTDTPGPGESVSAIRFIGKFIFSKKIGENEIFKNNNKSICISIRKMCREILGLASSLDLFSRS